MPYCLENHRIKCLLFFIQIQLQKYIFASWLIGFMHLEIKDIKLSILTISSISSFHFPSLILENQIFSN